MKKSDNILENCPSYKIFENFLKYAKKIWIHYNAFHSANIGYFTVNFFANNLILIIYKYSKIKSGGHRQSWGVILSGCPSSRGA